MRTSIRHPKFPRGNIYLSGGMQHADRLGAGWRAETSGVLQGMGYFPLDITALDVAYEEEHGALYSILDEDDHLQFKSNIRKHFVTADINLIVNDSDALIVLYDESVRRGAGTISECQIAYSHEIPVFLVSTWEDWEKEVPAWLQALTTKIFTSMDDLYAYLNDLPFGVITTDMYGNHTNGEEYLCFLSGETFKKDKTHFVSKVSPLLSKESVEVVKTTNEQHKDRYEFFLETIQDEIDKDRYR